MKIGFSYGTIGKHPVQSLYTRYYRTYFICLGGVQYAAIASSAEYNTAADAANILPNVLCVITGEQGKLLSCMPHIAGPHPPIILSTHAR